MRIIVALFLIAAPAAAEDVLVMSGMEIRGVREELSKFQKKLAPAPVDRGPVDALFERLYSAPQPALGRTELLNDKKGRIVSVVLHEVAAPNDCSGMYCTLVYKRAFTHLEVVVETLTEQPDRSVLSDSWRYEIGLGGSIEFCARVQMTGILGDNGSFTPDEKKSRVLRMSPSDPAVQTRWKRLVKELLTLYPTLEA